NLVARPRSGIGRPEVVVHQLPELRDPHDLQRSHGRHVGGIEHDRGMAPDVLDLFTPATRAWFTDSFDAPTPAQEGAWRSVAAGRNALVVAPTGSGKT